MGGVREGVFKRCNEVLSSPLSPNPKLAAFALLPVGPAPMPGGLENAVGGVCCLEVRLFEGKDPADLDGEGSPFEGRRLFEGVGACVEEERVKGRVLRADGNLGALLGELAAKLSFLGAYKSRGRESCEHHVTVVA